MSSLINACIGEYRITELLGAGGMGEVYKAQHLHLARIIAIKILLPNLTDSTTLRRFYAEAKIQASLRHPAVAEYFGFYEFQGRPCILMEYVDGETLSALLGERGRLPVDEVLRIGRDVVGVAAHFHALGVVHRDIKSNNIKITSTGQVKLLDFGIARLQEATTATREGYVVGTPTILAPEQIRGAQTTPATDVWQIGVLFYEMLAGRLPFEAPEAMELFAQIQNAEPLTLSKVNPAVPPHLSRIVARCLQKDPAKRYASAHQLMDALDAEAKPANPEPAEPAPPRPLPWRLIAIAAAVVIVLLLGFILLRSPASSTENNAGGGSTNTTGTSNTTGATNSTTSGGTTNNTSPGGNTKMVVVDTMNGAADVYRAGKKIGTTPLELQTHMGDSVEVVLHREGFKELPVQFEVTERKDYTYTLEPLR